MVVDGAVSRSGFCVKEASQGYLTACVVWCRPAKEQEILKWTQFGSSRSGSFRQLSIKVNPKFATNYWILKTKAYFCVIDAILL